MLSNKGSSLVELMVVITIIGILAKLGMPMFLVSKERALDKDAKAKLVFIQAAEKITKIETGAYYPSSGSTSVIGDINTNLGLSLTTGALSWAFKVDTGTSNITASRLPSGRVWTLTYTGSAATCTGTGCP